MRKTFALALLLFQSWSTSAHELAMQPFRAGTLAEIQEIRKGKPFILFLWSAQCADCRAQFGLLRELAQATPRVPLIIVSTDGPGAGRAGHALEEFSLDKEDLWAFEVADSADIRRDVDPRWDGKLPRTYLYDASHERQAISGNLDRGRVDGWTRQVNAMH